ncbi:MAG: hypothetical protein QHC89_28595 [Bosea sp. (in: a-proteobacteria)]|nr:hypothetical protein [Bosea sp. (in: a-proteobacteria)]
MGDPAFANMIVVCWTIAGYMGFAKGAVAFVDQNRIAAELGWGVATVKRALALAVAWGWLTRVRRPGFTNIYRMSFSRSVLASIELEHENRIKDFEIEAAKKKIARDAFRSLRSDPTESSDLIPPLDQVRSHREIRSDPLSSSSSTSPDPHQPSTERLGEGEQDMASGSEQKKALLDDVISALGRGDPDDGKRIAEMLPPARLDWLVSLVDQDGLVGAHSAIVAARNSVAPQH